MLSGNSAASPELRGAILSLSDSEFVWVHRSLSVCLYYHCLELFFFSFCHCLPGSYIASLVFLSSLPQALGVLWKAVQYWRDRMTFRP